MRSADLFLFVFSCWATALVAGCGEADPGPERVPAETASEMGHAEHAEHETMHEEAAEGAAEEEVTGAYGDPLDDALPLTTLASIIEDPSSYEDQVVRTRGTIAQVCQRMGCWMELREGEDGPAVRVPMAGHAFFLPRSAAGRSAEMQGRVALRELTADAREHLESEGASATASALSIEASGVVIN